MIDLLKLAAKVATPKCESKRSFYLGAVAVRRDQTVVKSSNGSSFSPFGPAHAEARVLKKAGHGATIYVARVTRKDGALTLSRPCNGCWLLMKSQYVAKCYYTISETEYGIIVFNNNSFTERVKIIT